MYIKKEDVTKAKHHYGNNSHSTKGWILQKRNVKCEQTHNLMSIYSDWPKSVIHCRKFFFILFIDLNKSYKLQIYFSKTIGATLRIPLFSFSFEFLQMVFVAFYWRSNSESTLRLSLSMMKSCGRQFNAWNSSKQNSSKGKQGKQKSFPYLHAFSISQSKTWGSIMHWDLLI